MIRLHLFLTLLLAMAAAAPAADNSQTGGGSPEGVVLVISDGTSLDLLTAARLYRHGAKGRLALEEMPHTAIVRTFSRSDIVTDSAAAATAMARGIKADNRIVGMEAAGKPAGPSIFDLAKARGWTTAVVTDDSVTGGTPAPFMVEHESREEHEVIAEKLIGQMGRRVDIVLGGGSKHFKSGLLQEFREEGGTVLTDWPSPALPEEGPVLGLFSPDTMSYIADGPREPRLVEMTELALQLIEERKKPFLLVIEASLPDKASHLNNALRAIREVLEVDAAIEMLLDELEDVLILVTTDHGTGGFAINGYIPVKYRGNALLIPNPVLGTPVFTFASGPGGIPDSNKFERVELEDGTFEMREITPRQPGDAQFISGALIPRDSALHTGGDVFLLGAGPGSERVHGFIDNTEVFEIMRDAVGGAGNGATGGGE